MMKTGYPEGRIFLSYPHTNNGFFFLLTTVFFFFFLFFFSFFFFFFLNKLPEVPEYAMMQFHMMTSLNITMTSLDDHVRGFQYNQRTEPSRDSLCKIAWVR